MQAALGDACAPDDGGQRGASAAKRFAIATLAAVDAGAPGILGLTPSHARTGWLDGALVLGCALQPVTYLADLVALCYRLGPTEQRAMHKAGWQCRSPPPVASLSPNQKAKGNRYWAWDYTAKIAPFALVPYERVVVIDSDMLVVRPDALAELLRWPWPEGAGILATRDCLSRVLGHERRWTDADADELQGGLIVLRPSAEACRDLVLARNTTPSRDGGGQGFMSSYFRGRVGWLPSRFNYVSHGACASLYDATTGWYRRTPPKAAASAPADEGLVARHLAITAGPAAVAMVHFQGSPKPWNCLAGNGTGAHACGSLSHIVPTRVHVLHAAWWAVAAGCGVGAAPGAPAPTRPLEPRGHAHHRNASSARSHGGMASR